jgi:hypothetical protein
MGTTFTEAPRRPKRLFNGRDLVARLERPRVQVAAAAAIGWVPLVALGAVDRLLTGRLDPLLLDVSVHVRLLVAVPLLLIAELGLAQQSHQALHDLVDEGFVGEGERARFDRLVRSAERLWNARTPQMIILSLALLTGAATLVGWLSPTGVIGRARPSALDAARIWFGVVALPLFLFLLIRALWRWVIWARTVAGLARLGLRLVAGHPDRRGGIGFLTLPSLAFNAPFLLAVSSVLCAAWGWGGGIPLREFQGVFVVFVVGGVLLAFGPLALFTPRLVVVYRAGIAKYGGLATDYIRRFLQRWMEPDARNELLGSADVQGLNDMGGAYRETVEKTSITIFGVRDLITILAVMLLPTVVLALSTMPLDVVMQKLGKLLVGARRG